METRVKSTGRKGEVNRAAFAVRTKPSSKNIYYPVHQQHRQRSVQMEAARLVAEDKQGWRMKPRRSFGSSAGRGTDDRDALAVVAGGMNTCPRQRRQPNRPRPPLPCACPS